MLRRCDFVLRAKNRKVTAVMSRIIITTSTTIMSIHFSTGMMVVGDNFFLKGKSEDGVYNEAERAATFENERRDILS